MILSALVKLRVAS